MTKYAIEADSVGRRFGTTEAVSDVRFALKTDMICGLLGRNGAGKTSLMSLITGQDRPTSGGVRVFGNDPFERAATLNQVSFIRDNQRYPDDYKLKHVLRIAPHFHEKWDAELAEKLAETFRIPSKPIVKKYSRGQLSALGVIIGIASRAKLTLLDEPYLGLDATARQTFYDTLIADYAEHPRTFLVSTHLIDEMQPLLEHVLVLDKGRLVLDQSTEQLAKYAYTVSGIARHVEQITSGHTVLHAHKVGALLSATVQGAPDADQRRLAEQHGVEIGTASLQQLVSALGSDHNSEHTDLSLEGVPS